jgi:hypothetical protein
VRPAAAASGGRGSVRHRVRLAGPGDDAALRRLLREGAMAGSIRLSLEREPSYFASLGLEAERHDTVVLEDPRVEGREGRIVAMGARLVHPATLTGETVRLGYLSHLRVAPGRRVARGALREGWIRLLEGRRDGDLPFDLTSIASDNLAARRLLERGLPGLPRYHPVGEYEVLAIPTGGGRWKVGGATRVRGVSVDEVGGGVEGPVDEAAGGGTPTAGGVAVGPGPPPGDREAALALRWQGGDPSTTFAAHVRLVAREGGRTVAGLSIVDPTPWRQYVIRGYQGALAWGRPLVNLGKRLLGAPILPRPGGRLRSGFITGLTCRPGHEHAVAPLIREAACRARAEGMATLLYGGMVGDRWARLLASSYRPRRYRTLLYLVARRNPGGVLHDLRRGPIHIDPIVL